MFKTMAAKYPGTCKRCQGPIAVGSKMRYGGAGRTYHLKAECPAGGTEDGGAGSAIEAGGPIVFSESSRGELGRERWARGYDALNGGPDSDYDR